MPYGCSAPCALQPFRQISQPDRQRCANGRRRCNSCCTSNAAMSRSLKRDRLLHGRRTTPMQKPTTCLFRNFATATFRRRNRSSCRHREQYHHSFLLSFTPHLFVKHIHIRRDKKHGVPCLQIPICQRAAEAWVRPPVSKITLGSLHTHLLGTRRIVLIRIFKCKQNK